MSEELCSLIEPLVPKPDPEKAEGRPRVPVRPAHRHPVEFLYEEWDQAILGQSIGTRKAYFDAPPRRPRPFRHPPQITIHY
ncbi:hypothetical protein [Streptomyces parvulus]|uniref:hypothetical protein n=1 Tax=Streptomyces parvulus TaxID=146923 RepID=UPI0036A0A8E5